jgi:hypothetical protein
LTLTTWLLLCCGDSMFERVMPHSATITYASL